MSSDGEPSEAAFSEAIRGSQETIADAIASDLETRYMALKKEKDSLQEEKIKQDKIILELSQKSKALEDTVLERDAELAAAKREKNTLQEKNATHEAEEKIKQERMSRMEAEADNLREEIRCVVLCLE